ncbi:MAG: DUF5677 domain-containing protein, partial [Nitrospira sp.]|nr:DUF5677 domain-containing protein [Nitrospira sp.]
FVERVSRYCHQTKFRVQPHSRDGQEIFAVGLFIKVMHDVEAAITLAERGFVSQAASVLRVALEALIKLGKICQSYEFVEAFIRIGELQRLRMVQAMRSNPARAFDLIRGDLTEDLVEDIIGLIGDARDETVKQWAQDIGLSALYDGQYRLFSSEVHSQPRSLERYIIFSDTRELQDIKFGPDLNENLRPELLEAARILMTALSFLNALFKLGIENGIGALTAELARLDEQATN